uniref:Amino-acid permease BAT1 homolog n=1 Tax=Nicotiana tabacum TaxID=4097 RepID=A0A1S4ALR2_TOBAC|nr:PREDICTED: amino-acid permease BAT1 homolog [Nicotiana tabacum]
MKAEGSALSSAGSYHRLAYHEVINDDNQNKIFTSDDSRLRQLGYKQELYRGLSFIANFSFTFAIVSVLTGISTLYNQALTFGGPITLVYGWPIVSLMTLIVGLAMAEICSAYPTSAGLYYWSAKLSGNYFGPFASWITGWYILFFSALVVPFLPKKNFSYFRIP